uniref:Uncharacterized protein n=1 Tax=Physcomitrium patens TaxID=3218 RepID=A0A2K1L470_PHYPA|nr:hypothetical protein PHYPA_003621 [Physcomitrium patens]
MRKDQEPTPPFQLLTSIHQSTHNAKVPLFHRTEKAANHTIKKSKNTIFILKEKRGSVKTERERVCCLFCCVPQVCVCVCFFLLLGCRRWTCDDAFKMSAAGGRGRGLCECMDPMGGKLLPYCRSYLQWGD